MLRVKDVYYKNIVYKIPNEDVRHINGFDVAKLPNETYVYYDDLDKKWKLASPLLIEEYTGKRYITVDFNGDMTKCLSYLDQNQSINDKKITKVNLECVVIYNDDEKVWKLLDKKSDLYNAYVQGQSD